MGFFTAEAMSGFAYSAESVAQLEAMEQVQRAEINPDTNNLDIYTVNVRPHYTSITIKCFQFYNCNPYYKYILIFRATWEMNFLNGGSCISRCLIVAFHNCSEFWKTWAQLLAVGGFLLRGHHDGSILIPSMKLSSLWNKREYWSGLIQSKSPIVLQSWDQKRAKSIRRVLFTFHNLYSKYI